MGTTAGTTADPVGRRARRVLVAAVALAILAGLAPTGGAPAGALSPLPDDGWWVTAAYRDLLEREPTPAQLAHRQAQRRAGVSRRTIADEVVGSGQHARVLVDRLYRRILGRGADAGSATFWADQLVSGRRDATVAGFLYGSPELYQRAGGTPEDFVDRLYRDVLGRQPDEAGLAYWSARVEAGENRTRLARSWYLSKEASTLRAGVVFVDLLRRPPSAAERADWAGRIQRFDIRRITAALVSTDEFDQLNGKMDRAGLVADGNGAVTEPSLSADGRWVAFASTASNLTPGGSPAGQDVFSLDLWTGRIRALTAGNGASTVAEISADGSTVVFQSAATDLVAGDTNGKVDVFRVPAMGGAVERLTDGDGDSTAPVPDADGSVVAFTSTATDLVADDPNGAAKDAFVHTDGQPATVVRVGGDADSTSEASSLSADGTRLGLTGTKLTDGGTEVTFPGAYLAALSGGGGPELQRIAALASDPRLAGDGRRVLYSDLSNGRPPAGAVVATLDATGAVTAKETVGSIRGGPLELTHDGGAVLLTPYAEGQAHPEVTVVGGGADPEYPTHPGGWSALPADSDVTLGGDLVVGASGGRLLLFPAGRSAGVW